MINLKKTNDGGLEAFNTPSHKYTPIKVGSAMSVRRWTAYERLNIAFGFNRTFTQLYESVVQMENLVASDAPFITIRKELILSLNSFKKGIVEESKTRYNHAFYLCTIFILKDDQKLSEWTIEDAEQTIQDWEENEVNEQDLFFFALNVSSGIRAALKSERQEIVQQTLNLSGLGT